jgi:hypothetical protein
MHNTSMLGRALNPVELSNRRYLDALIAFRPESCLDMTAGAAEGGAGDGGDAGQGGDGGSGGDTGAGAAQGSAEGNTSDDGKGDSGKGFPADTPVKDMTLEQQVAYHQYHSQKHETRNRELMAITGGKHGDALRKEMEELGSLRKEKLTPSEQAIEEAKAAARGELLPQLAETAFRVAIGTRKTEAEVDEFVADLNLTRFIKDGKVDTAKVLERVQQYAPDKDTGGSPRDFGQGKRGNGQQKSGVAAGAEMFAASKKSAPTS